LIGETAVERTQPKNIAALMLASDNGIDYFRFASPEELTALQNARNQQPIRHPAASPAPIAAAAIAPPAMKRRAAPAGKASNKRKDAVFVVHGRDDNARKALSALLGSLHVYIVEWEKALALTKKGSPYIGEVIDAGFNHAQAIVVLLTPDDCAKLRKPLLKTTDAAFERKLTGQPRQNVTFEAGMAFGKYKDTTILVEVGKIRPMSDLTGVHTVRLTNAAAQRKLLVGKLKTVGVQLDDSGNDWLTVGDFS
jgi:predicted nucleotide-binding protein